MRTFIFILLIGMFSLACVTTPAPTRLKSERPITVAVVVDRPGQLTAGTPPAEVLDRLEAALAKRNLVASFSSAAASERRLTGDRLATLDDKQDALLIELQPAYYSQLNGLFRWVVNGRITLRTTNGNAADSSEFERPVFLRFQHEGPSDAILAAEESLVRAAMYLIDDYLAAKPKEERELPPKKRQTARESEALYFIMVDRYQNGATDNDGVVDLEDPAAFHGGDLVGIQSDLDRLQRLGVTGLWLSPVYSMRQSAFEGHGAFHGYWVRDFDEVEARFGGWPAMDALTAATRERGMSLMLDVVLNHTDYGAPLVQERPELFHDEGPIEDWNDPVQLVKNQVHGLPDLAQERAATRAFLIDAHAAWVKRVQPRRLRIDAARHMDTGFVRDFGDAMRAARPGLEVVGEYWDGNAAELAAKSRAAGFDAVFDFPLYYALTEGLCKDGHLGGFAAQSSLDRLYPNAGRGLVTFVDNHDLPRVASACAGRVDQALTLVMLSRGVPAIAWGTEVPLVGAKEPDNRRDMRFGDHAHASTLAELLALREEHPALVDGETRTLALKPRFIAFERAVEGGGLVVAVNAGERAEKWPAAGALRFARGSCDGQVGPGAACVRFVERVSERVPMAEARVQAADGLVLVGAAPELGGWNPSRAPRSESGVIALELPPAVYECKLARVKGDGFEWEPRGNRYLVVTNAGASARYAWGS